MLELINMALSSIKANKLRAGLTLLSISIGVFAIVGIAAAIASLNGQISSTLSSFGQNTFTITKRPMIDFGDNWRKYRKRKDITVKQGFEFKKRLSSAQSVDITNWTTSVVAKFADKETNPNVTLLGTTEGYIAAEDFQLESGRGLSPNDINLKSKVVVLGSEVAEKILPNQEPLGKTVSLNNKRYTVIGVLESKGSMLGQSRDNIVLIPVTAAALDFFDEWENSVSITVRSYSMNDLSNLVDQSIMQMRNIRMVPLGADNDFEVVTNENISETFSGFTGYVETFGLVCGGIALLAAGVGIMNIMLVNAKERTREIGIRKALGATRSNILTQFLIEAITLCQLGALFGIIPGLLAGIGISLWLKVDISLPWVQMIGAIAVCTFIGLVFGGYPAWKAASLDPIEALRYE